MPFSPSMCHFCLFTLKISPTLFAFEHMESPPVIVKRTFTCKSFFTDVTVGMAHRFLMLTEGVIEVKPLIAVRAIKAMKGVTVALKSLSSVEKAVAMMAEAVACGALMVF